MTTFFYTVIGFAPKPHARISRRWQRKPGRIRSFGNVAAARRERTLLQGETKAGVTYKILLTTVHEDGGVTTHWVE